MSTHYLIFPLVLSEESFIRLATEIVQLDNLNFDNINWKGSRVKNMIYYTHSAIFDLREILRNRNTRGYRFNSYLLNMITLKLTFIKELLMSVSGEEQSTRMYTINDAINSINEVLLVGYALHELG